MMNVLYDEFPDFVEVDGKLYKIITDFRDWIRLNDLVDDDEVNDIDKVNLLLMWFDGEIPDNIEGAIYALGDFLTARGIYRDSETGEKKKDIAGHFLSVKMLGVYIVHSGNVTVLIYRRLNTCTGGSFRRCLTGFHRIQRLSSA